MADRATLCGLARPLPRQADPRRHGARHGQSTGPTSRQSRLAHGGAESPYQPQRSRGLCSPHAADTRAGHSHDSHGPHTGQHYRPSASRAHTLSGTERRRFSPQRSGASEATLTQAGQVPGLHAGAAAQPFAQKHAETQAKKPPTAPRGWQTTAYSLSGLCALSCAIDTPSRQ